MKWSEYKKKWAWVIFTAIIVGCLAGLVALFNSVLDAPLAVMKFEISLVVLSIVSMITLQYVGLINRLRVTCKRNVRRLERKAEQIKEKNPESELGKAEENYQNLLGSIKRTSWTIWLLCWANALLFITIGALLIRIFYLLLDSNDKVPILADSFMVASFILGSALRIFIFFHSYWKEFFR